MGLLSVLASFLTLVYVVNAQAIGRGTVRLYSNNSISPSLTAGIVQIYYGNSSTGINRWGNICEDDSFGHNEADVICNQLGYNGALTYGKAGSSTRFGTDPLSTVINDVTCSDDDFLTLQQCTIDTTISSSCGDSNDAFVVCYSTRIWDTPYSGQIRLLNESYSNYGRLEVYCNGQWGTVCDDGFGSIDARVACRQLGYSDSYTYSSTGDLNGSNTQAIWLSNIDCSSDSQSCLAYCTHCPTTENQQCAHSQDISLGCEFSSDYAVPSNTLETCRYADDIASLISDLAAIIGGIVAVFVVCCILIITIPICICCCLGVGVGALIGGSKRRTPPQQTPAAIEAGAASSTKSNPLSGTNPPPQNGQHLTKKEKPPAEKANPPAQEKAMPLKQESPAPKIEISPPKEEVTVVVKEEAPQEESPPPPPPQEEMAPAQQLEEIQEISPPQEESPPPQDEVALSQHNEVPSPPQEESFPPQDEVPPPSQDDEIPPSQDEVPLSSQDNEVPPSQDEEIPPSQDEVPPPSQDEEIPPSQDEVPPSLQDVPPQEVSSPEVQEIPAAAPQEEIPQQEEPVQQENSAMQEKEEEQPTTEI